MPIRRHFLQVTYLPLASAKIKDQRSKKVSDEESSEQIGHPQPDLGTNGLHTTPIFTTHTCAHTSTHMHICCHLKRAHVCTRTLAYARTYCIWDEWLAHGALGWALKV